MSNLKQLRPIDPNSEANDGPGQAEQDRMYAVSLERTHAKREADTADLESAEVSYAMSQARAVAKAQAAAQSAPPVSVAWSALIPAQKHAEEPEAGREIKGKRDAVKPIDWGTLTTEEWVARYSGDRPTPTPKRDAYQRALAQAVKSLAEAAALNLKEENTLMSIVAEIKNLAA